MSATTQKEPRLCNGEAPASIQGGEESKNNSAGNYQGFYISTPSSILLTEVGDGTIVQGVSPSATGSHDTSDADLQGWEIIEKWESNDETCPSREGKENQFHFDITVGLGRWKHTLVAVDYEQTVTHRGPGVNGHGKNFKNSAPQNNREDLEKET